MPKRKKRSEIDDSFGIVKEQSIETIMPDRYGKYAKYIIQERAIPDVRDGLKPVQRRIIYGMFKDGNVHDKPYRKAAKAVGMVLGGYHPHGLNNEIHI